MVLFNIPKPAVPHGGWVVVTGVSGLVGSHVADQALRVGFRVRRTTRSTEKNAWVKEHFQSRYGVENFELFEVPDMVAKGAFENVVAENVVDVAINGIKAAAKESSTKCFIYTSSSFAATFLSPDKRLAITTKTFNDGAVRKANLPGPEGDVVYAASKVEAERRIMAWVKKNKPNLVKALCGADYDVDLKIPAQHFVNVQDDARLHCVALAHLSLESERIFAVAGPVKSNAIINILRRQFPQKGYKHVLDDENDLAVDEPAQRAEELLVEVYGTGFASLEESVSANTAELVN
ncbi:Epimerase domain-containing protein [Fusarium falciforme]|uniref:Epimerase domain-containing protein n=1 Tax=Fusarium falciforme TaxID=195108 RepID=UPI0023018A8E|nr:Epimerase domain-containing protein [Fusarium falciforme]WAO96864.1 Epimerase domain-containing protein [Fusarium falciforme]